MGTYNYRDVPLGDVVAGFGNINIVNGFNTDEINSHLKINGVPARAIPKDPSTMPFSNLSLPDYKMGGSSERWHSFAESGKFIISKSVRINYAINSGTGRKTVYYVPRDSIRNMGELYIGDTLYQRNCPQVALFGFQAGNGDSGGYRLHAWYVTDFLWLGHWEYNSAGGGGGGGGAFSCFQVNMNPDNLPYGTRIEVLTFESDSQGTILIYPKNLSNVVISLSRGDRGQDGYITNRNVVNIARGGRFGTGIQYALPSNWRAVFNTFGSNHPGNGGNGGYYAWNNQVKGKNGDDQLGSFVINSSLDGRLSGFPGGESYEFRTDADFGGIPIYMGGVGGQVSGPNSGGSMILYW